MSSTFKINPQIDLNISSIITPFAAKNIQGLSYIDKYLLAIDTSLGYLLKIDPETNNTQILNPENTEDFIGITDLAIEGNTLWVVKDNLVYFCQLDNLKLQTFLSLKYPINGIAVSESTLYLSCQKFGYILVYSHKLNQEITRFYLPGIGQEKMTIKGENLWICDDIEQSIYCLDRATGSVIFNVLTPFEHPQGLSFYPELGGGEEKLYIAYANEEPFIRDNPNVEPNFELDYRDRTFIHPLTYYYNAPEKYALSNGYLIEMSYVEELAPLAEFNLNKVEWRIALPSETQRQQIVSIEPIGVPFTEEVIDGQRVAVFKFEQLKSSDRYIFGWKALMRVYSIKYQLTPQDVENCPPLPPEFTKPYLTDNDNLAMDTYTIRRAAQEAIGTETNILRQIYKIRNYVYDRLSYGIKPRIDPPDVALERGVGSCGEYLGVLLALARLNGIACRTVGRYKCPKHPEIIGLPQEPEFNHVWMEFYIPGFGWLPMESNPDDIVETGPYPSRFFMGLAWYHTEIGKGISFTTVTSQNVLLTKETVPISDLAINHVRYRVLGELSPLSN
ncbi:transglutaminase-like domain-containing protein [Merismopedia glauca]|uniref:Transglutaminase n=1 Tax=Merismopedia glauca CCAP 1448/3 TaxID=1296344 RepID=A0A2T1BX12_9CYAN|nr:transglutaminase family protein [Merismopedia glauca]PSB00556.1 transglutaminase [Merismopedia glauca CCAP 1448/3]